MTHEYYKPARLFTIQQANATLPLVRAIVRDIVELSRHVIERRRHIQVLGARQANQPRDVYSEEVAQIEADLEKDNERLSGFVEELRELGVELKSAPDGLVDFPSVLDGRLVYLCWKYGEPEVLYWHELEAGFAGRQALAAHSGIHDPDDCGHDGSYSDD